MLRELGRLGISTHSLTRRLTPDPDFSRFRGSISTHSLTRRLTILMPSQNLENVFQLTASQGG